jgi:tRNA(Arg) A34 adenosine deaminase TadA
MVRDAPRGGRVRFNTAVLDMIALMRSNGPERSDEMDSLSASTAPERDQLFLRRSFEVARRAMSHGNHPFGAVLVDGDGRVLIEAENGYMPSHDGTAHAERLLATEACTTYGAEILKASTLYSSAEPCAMCAGAMYWAGIGRLVYGLSEHRLRAITGDHPENPTLNLPCRQVFETGQRPVEVVGPLLEDEAAALHAGVWTAKS